MSNLSSQSFITPTPAEWVTSSLYDEIFSVLSHLQFLPNNSPLIPSLLSHWIEHQVLQVCLPSSDDFRSFLHSSGIDPLECDYIPSSDSTNYKILEWSFYQWGHRLETLYLSRKDLLDTFTARLLSVDDQNLAYELYLRLKENEVDFSTLSIQYGTGPEKYRGGLLKAQSVSSLPSHLKNLVQSMHKGSFLKPFPYAKGYAVLQLEELNPALFDFQTKVKLLNLEFADWQSSIISYITNKYFTII